MVSRDHNRANIRNAKPLTAWGTGVSGWQSEGRSMNRPKLSDIVRASNKSTLAEKWAGTTAAAEYGILPKGEYDCLITDGSPH